MGDPEGGLIGFILICIIVFTVMFFKAVREWGRPERERKAAEELLNRRKKLIEDWESKSRPGEDGWAWYRVVIQAGDLPRVTDGLTNDDNMGIFLLKPRGSSYIHISQPTKTPDLKLTGIQYNGQYSHTTTGEISGNTGNAILGGMIAGSTGAQIGAAGKRTVTTTTIDQEISSWNILEFEVVETGEQVAISVILDKDDYQYLYKNYLFRGEGPADIVETDDSKDEVIEAPVTETQEPISADRTAKLVSLSKAHEGGILTDEEFSRKVSELD